MELIRVTAEFFAEKGIESPRLDAELLLAHVLGCTRLQLYLNHERPVVATELDHYRALVRERGKRVPLQLLVGEVEILEHSFLVRAGVFIPRPETEVLIERCRALPFAGGAPGTIVEAGVGTGCIGLSLLTHWPQARLVGYDVNPAAIELTRENAERLHLADRLELRATSAFEGPELGACDLLVSNPPYVRADVIDSLAPEVRDHDPREALDGGDDGLDAVRALAARGLAAVVPGGWIALEHGDDQGESAPAVLRAVGWTDVAVHDDLSGRPRVTIGRRPA
jgi:release factor glutamine methyltransferase